MTWQTVVVIGLALGACVALALAGQAEHGSAVLAFLGGLIAPTPKILRPRTPPQ